MGKNSKGNCRSLQESSWEMKKDDVRFILSAFLSWRVLLFLFVALGIAFFPLQENFLGGRLENYLKNPYFWSFLNFDGEHYASIAYQGYLPLTYFYFPFYPLVARLIVSPLGESFINVAISGLLVSNLSFAVGLFGLWKLVRLDYKRNVATLTVILLLLFPTSFYFGAFYTESLVFALIVWAFYLARKRQWLAVGILAAMATATRITALALLPALAYEVWEYRRKKNGKIALPIISLALIPMGLGIYMYYLYRVTGDPLEFFNAISLFGQQRSAEIVLLPQVFYRYFFKVLPNLDYSYFPAVFTSYLEIGSAVLFFILGVWAFFKIRLSYAFFLAAGYLIPPLSGSFSSFPRYVLILFPAFILLAVWLNKKSKIVRKMVFLILFVLLSVACALFARGYWVS